MTRVHDAGADRPQLAFRETERTKTKHTTSKFDWALVSCRDGQVVGTLDLMTDVDDDEPGIFVRMVRSARPGVASAMLDELGRRYPKHFVHGGPISDHEAGGRQLLRRRLILGLPTIHAPACSAKRCVCVEELSDYEELDALAERRFHVFGPAESLRHCAE